MSFVKKLFPCPHCGKGIDVKPILDIKLKLSLSTGIKGDLKTVIVNMPKIDPTFTVPLPKV